MEDQKFNSTEASGSETGQEKELSRRQLLKVIAATSGVVATSSLLPSKWAEPVIDVGYLPAHAQASPQIAPTPSPLGTGDFQTTLTWNTGNLNANDCVSGGDAQGAVDIDLHVVEPDGTRVFFANRTGPTAQLDIDNQKGFGPENIFVPQGQTEDGTYLIQVVYFCGSAPTTATITVRVFANTSNEQTFTFTRNLTSASSSTLINVAEATYSSGDVVVQEVTGVETFDAPPNANKA